MAEPQLPPEQPMAAQPPAVPEVSEVLSFGDILSYSFRWGFGQYFRIFLMLVLWVLTVWIPYVNVGTTIAVTIGAPLLLSRRQRIDPTFIFDRRYRHAMADWFILTGLIILGILLGLLFLVIPAVVLALGWLLAPLVLVDRGVGAVDALRQSWQATQGEKWTLFFGLVAVYLIYAIPAAVVYAILSALLPDEGAVRDVILALYAIAAYTGLIAVDLGYTGYVYAVLGKRVV